MNRPAILVFALAISWLSPAFTRSTLGQTLSHLLPAAAARGQTTLVSAFGTGLAKVATLHTTFPATVTLAPGVPVQDNQVTFAVTVPPDAIVGLYGARLVTDSGISDLKLFVVEDLPIVTNAGNNQTRSSARKVALPSAISGIMGAEQSDFYAFTVAAGQRLACEVVAHRLGTDIDPLVRIWNSAGKEVASCDNSEGLGFDCRFAHVFAAAGDHVVEVRDSRYAGGGNWNYHLRLGDFPSGRVVYPAGGKRGWWLNVAFPGRVATDLPPALMQLPTDPLQDAIQLAAGGGNGSAWFQLVLDDEPPQLELEPNDTLETANGLALPRTLYGRLQAKGDADVFAFFAKAGVETVFRADSRRLASPVDLELRVQNAAGNLLLQVDDNGLDDALATFKAPADGQYFLTIRDLLKRGGVEFIYRIQAAAAPVDFGVHLTSDRVVVPRGSKVPLLAKVARTRFGGALELHAQSGCEQIKSLPCQIPVNTVAWPMEIAAAIDAPLGLHRVQVRGVAQMGSETLTRAARTDRVILPKLNNLRQIPPGVDREIPVLVVPVPFFTLAAKLGASHVGRFTTTPFTVTATREKFFDEPIQIQVENLPPNVQVAVQPIAKSQNAVTLQFDSKPNTPIGAFFIFVSGTAAFQGRSVRVYSEILPISLRAAFGLKIDVAEARIVRGGKVAVPIRVERHPGYAGPIAVELVNLPKGITATKTTVPEKKDTIRVEISAATDAPPVVVVNLAAVGRATISGQADAFTSPTIKLTVAEK